MFGKKKEVVEYDGQPVLLSKREAFNRFVGYEQFREELDLVNKKLELILSEMNLTYQSETEKKEPARLVKKQNVLPLDFGSFVCVSGGHLGDNEPTKPKKKRGRPKKK